MREILFRGKRIDNSEWVYGYYSGGNNDFEYCEISDIRDPTLHRVEVASETVGQFTGLSDKNSKRIFEGDIVRDEVSGKVASVEYLAQECGWCLVFKKTDCRLGHRSRGSDYDRDSLLEVIGNIHDNPELLEGP